MYSVLAYELQSFKVECLITLFFFYYCHTALSYSLLSVPPRLPLEIVGDHIPSVQRSAH